MQIEKQHDVYLSLGSNLGDREGNILLAIQKINERIGMVLAYSAFYVTKPVGFESSNDFVNAACVLLTSLAPFELLKETQQIEIEMGRTHKSHNHTYADRIIDLDILFYDDLVLVSEELILPHPHLHERLFVLDPLKDIAGDYLHPVLKKTIDELKESL